MNHRILRNHPHMWRFIQFMQAEEKIFRELYSSGPPVRRKNKIHAQLEDKNV
jgi:hypothetical protein